MIFNGMLPISLILAFFFLKPNHAIYVSVIEIEKNAGGGSGTMNVKVFFDDLEEAVYNDAKVRKSYQEGCLKNDQELINYFEKYLNLKINSKPLTLNLSDCERLEDAMWLTFKFKTEPNWSSLYISANYFMELFPAQMNVVSVTNGNEKKFTRLELNKHTTNFTF